MIRPAWRRRRWLFVGSGCLLLAVGTLRPTRAAETASALTGLLGLGDSLTQGTMDATNNEINTAHAYLQRVRNALAQRIPLAFSQPFFDLNEDRINPSRVPTNLAVDGTPRPR